MLGPVRQTDYLNNQQQSTFDCSVTEPVTSVTYCDYLFFFFFRGPVSDHVLCDDCVSTCDYDVYDALIRLLLTFYQCDSLD